jgi:DNA helicase-2/ATP-dependent DNA helicase PcrA
MEKLTENLNEKQLEAVTETEGYVRVIAGAGSGKTKALTSRYAYIVEALGINSSNILCVTFTNKAAQEMRKRVKRLVGEDSDLSLITTYHGFCVRVLREDINKIQYPKSFIIMDVEDQKTILRDIFNELGLTSKVLTFKQALRFISKQKSSLGYLEYILEAKEKNSENDLQKVFIRYLEKQQRNFALDFDDLLNFTLYVFNNHPDILDKWQKRMHYIQVDENQDSSQKQFMLIEMLSRHHQNLFVVGDPDQTIYEWRGAKPEILVDFDKQFVDSKTIFMNQNYRSTPNILSLGNHIIKNNSVRVEKDMFTNNQPGVDVVHFHGRNDYEEGVWVAHEIKRLVESESVNFSDFAILYRANHVSRTIEQSLIKESIPYSIFGGIRFFERKEIKDVLAYLRLVEFEDDFSFLRIINTPSRGLGKKFIQNVARIAENENVSLYSALVNNISQKDLNKKGAIEFLHLIDKFKQLKDESLISDLVKRIIDESGLSAHYRTDGDTDRLDNIKEFQSSIILLETQEEDKIQLVEYLQEIALYTDMDVEDGRNEKVKLMTIHTSKGLEFPYVFLCGFTEGILPSSMSIKEKGARAIEEERRLTYVAITRAEKGFYMTESQGFNFTTGLNKYPSRFLFEIEENYFVRKGKLSEETINEAKDFFKSGSIKKTIEKKFEVDDWVNHNIWNVGKVIEVNENKGEYQVEFFDSKKVKPINFSFKGLHKISDSLKAQIEKEQPEMDAIRQQLESINEEIEVQAESEKEIEEVQSVEPESNVEISETIERKIRKIAKKEYPKDKEMQDYVFKNQMNSYLFMEKVKDMEVKGIALLEYPKDYGMQEYIYNNNIKAKEFMNSVSDLELKGIAIEEYPKDYTMQEYVYTKQSKCKNQMLQFLESENKSIAISEWPSDYCMQVYAYEKL